MRTNNLIEIIEFLKDDKAVLARLKNIQDAEAGLKEKLKVADSVAKAEKMQAEAEEQWQKAYDQELAYKTAYDARVSDLEAQYRAKNAELQEKAAKINVDKKAVQQMADNANAALVEARDKREEAMVLNATAAEKLAQAKEKEAKMLAKLAKLKGVMEE